MSIRDCSNVVDDEEAVVLACTSSVFCAVDLHQSQEQLLEKSEVDMPTPVHDVVTPLNTCSASRACRARRAARRDQWRKSRGIQPDTLPQKNVGWRDGNASCPPNMAEILLHSD